METLAAFSESKPLILMLDDLQWADELTLGFLGYLVRARSLGAPQMPRLLVIGTYRTEENIEALRMLTGSGGAQTVRLGRLDDHALGEMVCEMLALAEPPTEFVRYLSRESEGNPFFVAEYLHAAVREGVLWRDVAGSWQVAEPSEKKATLEAYARLPLPHSIRALVARHLDRLGTSGRRLADAAAILGKEVDLSLLASVSAMEAVDVLEGTVELLGQHVMEESRRGSLRFVHDKLREVAYQDVAEPRRSELHRAVAERMESFEPARRDENLAALARHWQAAGETDKAKPYWLAAARKARANYAHGEAERLYRGYLRLVSVPTPESIEARNQLAADVLLLQGKFEDATTEHAKALAESRDLGHLWSEAESFRFLGLLTRARGRPEEAREIFEQALACARELQDRRLEGRVLGSLGICSYDAAQFEPARELFTQALAIHREVGERAFEGAVLCNLANTYNAQSRIDEARELYAQSLAIQRSVGDRRGEGLLLGNLASASHDQGRFDEARKLNEQALAIHREVGNRITEGQCLRNLASSLHDQGRFDEARELYVQALAIHREVGDRRSEGVVLQRMGNACQDQGRIEEAWDLYAQAVSIHREVGNRRFEGMVLHDMANCRRDQGRIEEARALCEDSLAIHREVGDRLEGMVLGALADLIRLTTGDIDRAEKLASDGESMLSDAGDRLELARLLCIRGHIKLAGAASASAFLDRASTLGLEMKIDSRSELGQKLAKLARAQSGFEENAPLFRGAVVTDLAPGLRNWLEQTGQLRAEG